MPKFEVGDLVRVVGTHIVQDVKSLSCGHMWLIGYADHGLELVSRDVPLSRPCIAPPPGNEDVTLPSFDMSVWASHGGYVSTAPMPRNDESSAEFRARLSADTAFKLGLPKVVLALVAATAVVLALFAVATSCTAQPAPQDPTPPTWDGGTQ